MAGLVRDHKTVLLKLLPQKAVKDSVFGRFAENCVVNIGINIHAVFSFLIILFIIL